MRTTVTLDPDVAERVQELAHRRRASFKETLNTLLRRGLVAHDSPATDEPPFVVHPHRGGFKPGIDAHKLNQLADALEAEDFRREARK